MIQPLVRNAAVAGNEQQSNFPALSDGAVPSSITRPRLKRTSSYLFYSKHNHIDIAAAVGHHSIQLPSGMEDRIIKDTNSSILSQIWHIALIGSTLCLIASVRSTLSHVHPSLVLYVIGWAATLLLVRKTLSNLQHPHGILLLSWTLIFSILTVIHLLFFYHSNTISLSYLSIPAPLLFFFARSVHMSYSQLQHDTRKRVQDQVKATQTFVDQSTSTITSARLGLLEGITQEIRSAASIITTTLEHFAPAAALAHSDEFLSACTIAVPVTSISAIHTAIKQVNHINSNIDLVTNMLASEGEISDGSDAASCSMTNFDVAELIQSVGDALAGMAANLDVHLVIYHTDNSLHYSTVAANEGALRHTLMDLICRIMEEGSGPGATIELGVSITSLPPKDARLRRVAFDIVHTCSPAVSSSLSSALSPTSHFGAQLMQYIGGSMTVEHTERGRIRFCLTVDVDAVSCENAHRQHFVMDTTIPTIFDNQFSGLEYTKEPTRKELEVFIEDHLKRLKMVLYAPKQSVFATHLTRYLANLNADISHIPITCYSTRATENEQEQTHLHPPTPTGQSLFVLIDDDVVTLERVLRGLRTPSLPSQPQSVPEKAAQQRYHRRHGSKGSQSSFGYPARVMAIICFGSLNKYKHIRTVIQSFASQHLSAMPRVLVIPKPAGPLRFLTALHTAWYNPVVEPHYFPIATSPLSPMIARPAEPFTSGPITPSECQTYWSHPSAIGNEPPLSSKRQQQQHRISPVIASSGTEQHYFSVLDRMPPATSLNVDSKPKDIPARLRSLSGTFLPRNAETHLDALATPFRCPQDVFGGYGDDVNHCIEHMNHRQKKAFAIAGYSPGLEDSPSSEAHVTKRNSSSAGAAASLVTTTSKASQISGGNAKEPTGSSRHFFLHNKKKRDKRIPFSNSVSPPINVLIVEDNKINQVILQTWMKKHNIKHSSATNGQEAVEKWKGGGFHLVLMDIQLPIMSGIEATKAIRAIEREQRIGVLPAAHAAVVSDTVPAVEDIGSTGATTPLFRSPVIIVALTASSLESDRHAALAAGCNDFLTKPLSLEWLEKKIVEWGCMQALIDFEGWRRWRESTSSISSPFSSSSNLVDQKCSPLSLPKQSRSGYHRLSRPEKPTEGQVQYLERPGPLSSSRRAISMQDGILLPGVGSQSARQPKRTASMDDAPLQRGGGKGN
ncbi:hypothetical protein BX666DRAFT_2025548 [Dichotomocladium elegans]|nr:hypothetical protein BX666DRAFT_2025548 [Dichotomocladium elegans]